MGKRGGYCSSSLVSSSTDIRERFHYVVLLMLVSVRNLAQFNWNPSQCAFVLIRILSLLLFSVHTHTHTHTHTVHTHTLNRLSRGDVAHCISSTSIGSVCGLD